MRIGTKTLLFGVHQFLLHPLFVAMAWWRLYGFPWNWRLWPCFLVHDWGYWGCRDLDGDEGSRHPEYGARLISRLLDRRPYSDWLTLNQGPLVHQEQLGPWGKFCLLHSRNYARSVELLPSRLCMADKLAICLMPEWLYLTLAWLTGELAEYQDNGKHATPRPGGFPNELQCYLLQQENPWLWLRGLKSYMQSYVSRSVEASQ